eukprot:g10850.t1
MNFNHAVQGGNLKISMAADDFIRMNQVQAQLQQRVDQLSTRCGAFENEIRAQIQAREQERQQAEQISSRYCELGNALRAQVQARQTIESQLFQEKRGRQACENEIESLRQQLHQERLRTDGMWGAGRPVHNPASIPLRIVPVGDSRMDQAQAREVGLHEPVNPSYSSEPSSGGPLMSHYPLQIPEEDREAIRARMLKDRGPSSTWGDTPTTGTPAPAPASSQDMDTAPRAPSPGAKVSGPSRDDGVSQNEITTSEVHQQEETGAADVDSEETEDDCAANDMEIDEDYDRCVHHITTPESNINLDCAGEQRPCGDHDANEPASVESSTAAENVVTNPTAFEGDRCAHDTTTSASSINHGCPREQGLCADHGANEVASLESSTAAEHVTYPTAFEEDRSDHDTTTSASSTTFGCAGKQEQGDEDDADESISLASPPTVAEHVISSTAAGEDRYADDTTTSASSTTLDCRGKQEPCNEDGDDESASLASGPTAGEKVVANRGVTSVKTEHGAVPCSSAAPAAPTTACKSVPSSSAADDQQVKKAAGISSLSGGGGTPPPTVKTEAISSRTSTAVSRQAAVASAGSTSPSPISSHQLFSSYIGALPYSVDDREARDVDTQGGDDCNSSPSTGRDRYSHNTFCSSCKGFRTEHEAIAKCAACPRMLCRTCAGRKGEKVPPGANADDILLCPDKCLCQKRDSEFTKPRGGTDPQAHLLKQLRKHDLAHMFLKPVEVEENPDYLTYISRDDMIDLGTMTTKMLKRKQYQSSRGKLMFRRDLKRIWENCWKFAGHTPESCEQEAAGIVRCTIILEAMINKFYEAYMEEKELVTDQDSWLAERERRHKKKFAMCANPSGGAKQYEPEPSVAAAKFRHDSDDDVDLDEENRRIGTTVRRKRKFVLSDDDDDDRNGDTPCPASASTVKAGLDPNICALAEIGEHLKRSSGKT